MTQKNEPTGDRYFGVCPICKQTDGYLNIGRSHGFVCHAHKKKWCMGSNPNQLDFLEEEECAGGCWL